MNTSGPIFSPHQVQPVESAEFRWMRWLGSLPASERIPALRAFAGQYHYFSLNQVVSFSRLLQIVPSTDREALSILADVLHEELGRNRPERVHSVLFERFASHVGVDVQQLPLSSAKVVAGVRAYVVELNAAFGGHSLARALATYQFLESSAVETYGPLTELLRSFDVTDEAVEFFEIHATVEIEHAEAADRMLARAGFGSNALIEIEDQRALLRRCWQAFWRDIHQNCEQAIS